MRNMLRPLKGGFCRVIVYGLNIPTTEEDQQVNRKNTEQSKEEKLKVSLSHTVVCKSIKSLLGFRYLQFHGSEAMRHMDMYFCRNVYCHLRIWLS
jgi:chemotaxis methyl-accepting protein methylase